MIGLLAIGFIKADGLYKSPEKMAEFIRMLPSKNIYQSADLTRKWINFHIDRLKLVIKESKAMREQFKGSEKAKWDRVVNLREELVKALEEVPVKYATKSLEYMPDWLALDARKLLLLSEQLKAIARETEYKDIRALLEKKAKYVAKKGHRILKALNIAKAEPKPKDKKIKKKKVCPNLTKDKPILSETLVEPAVCREASCALEPTEFVEYTEPTKLIEPAEFVEYTEPEIVEPAESVEEIRFVE